MRSSVAVLGAAALLAAGLTAAVALGSSATSRSGSTTSAGPITTLTTTSKTETETEAAAPKVWVCHHTGSWKHPYHLIHISANALAAHRGHGDVDPGAGKSCPSAQPTGLKHGHGRSAATHGHAAAKAHAQGNKPDDEAEPDDQAEPDDEPSAPPAHTQIKP